MAGRVKLRFSRGIFSSKQRLFALGEELVVDLMELGVVDDAVGLHFNAQEGSPSDTMYVNDIFRHNGTAVLLKQVPNRQELEFPGTRFEDNGQDIDNRCGQDLDLSETVFR